MKNSILKTILFLIFILSSCEKKQDTIEIYLTKKRIETNDGVSLKIGLKDSLKRKGLTERFGEEIRFDTITNKVIFAGHFSVNKEDLEEKPFITNSEILDLVFEHQEIHLTKSAAEKITKSFRNWNKEKHFGKQFVMCHNNKVILKGYFFGSMSSYLSNTYQILYYPLEQNKRNNKNEKVSYVISDGLNFEKNNLMKNKELVEAFKSRNKK